jgi:hypothetical protein
MAKFRSIQTSFWSDSKIVDDFTPEDRYFYLYLLTNEKSNQLGCYELSKKQMCSDTGYDKETIEKLLNKCKYIDEIIIFDNTMGKFKETYSNYITSIMRIIDDNNNYVNIAWNKGIEIMKNKLYIMSNDDVILNILVLNKLCELYETASIDAMIESSQEQ